MNFGGMTYGEMAHELIGSYIISSLSYVAETFSILSAIFMMICFFGKDVKLTKKTFLVPGIFAATGIVYHVIVYALFRVYAGLHWDEIYTVNSDGDQINNLIYYIIRIALFLVIMLTCFFTFKKHKFLNGFLVWVFVGFYETYIEMTVACSVAYFSGNPEEVMKQYAENYGFAGPLITNVYIIAFLIITLMLFLALYFGMYKKQRFMYIGWKYRIFFVVWEVVMFILTMMPLVSTEGAALEQKKLMGYVIGTIMPVMGIAIPFLIITMISRRNAVEKTIIQEGYISAELDYINQYKKNQNETRAFRHDIINNLSMLSAMMNEKKYDEVEEHLEALLGEVKGMSPKYVTGDEMLDCIVGMKSSKMDEEGIDFTIDGVADGGLGMKPVDVCSIFANAMDNAIEACEKLPEEKEKRIQLIMKRTERFFSIKLINSMSDDENSGAAGKLFGEGGRITTKKDKNLHGFGTQNMKAAISRYDGMLKAEAEDGIFTLSIMIPRMA